MKKVGFTLVELVITITILVILSTIAFVSFQSYTQDSRDANRLSSLNEIQKGLTLSYSKNGTYPSPQNATTYTGGTLSLIQGMITQQILPELQSDPKDPLSKSNYTYSTTSDGEYFQIASDIENTDVLSQVSLQKTYAKVSSALVKGNYKFDPSLPSLVVIPTTSLTNSGIFSPDNCFVTNGGSNTIGNTTCTTKKQIGLKNLDSRVLAYWDMETLTGAKMFDFSGNENFLIFSGQILPVIQSGSKGTYFNGQSLLYTDKLFDYKNTSEITVSMLLDTQQGTGSYSMIMETSSDANTATGAFYITEYYKDSLRCMSSDSKGKIITNVGLIGAGAQSKRTIMCTNEYSSPGKKYLTFVFQSNKEGEGSIFQNGSKIGNIDVNTNSSLLFDKTLVRNFVNNILYIGNRVSNTSNGTIGTIDEVKIYNRALSDKEIEQQAKILGF